MRLQLTRPFPSTRPLASLIYYYIDRFLFPHPYAQGCA